MTCALGQFNRPRLAENTTLSHASLHRPLEKLAHVSVEMAASDETIRPVLDIIQEVKEQGNGTEVKYNNLKVRRLLEEAAENFMLGLATVDKSVLEWLAKDCTMIDPSLDENGRNYVVHGKDNIIEALGSDSPTAYKVRTSRYIPISTFVEQGKIFSYWEGLIRESTTKGANKAKEASKTTEALRAEEDMKGDFHVGKFGGAFVIYLDKNVMIERVEFSCMSGKLALSYPTHWEREGAFKGLSTSLAMIPPDLLSPHPKQHDVHLRSALAVLCHHPTTSQSLSVVWYLSEYRQRLPSDFVFTMNGSPEIDPVQEAIHFWCNDENVDWLEEILHTHLQPLIDNINAGGLHSSWEWFTDDATLTTSINLPRCEGTTFEGREAINDYFASQYNAEPRMKFVPLLCTYGQGHMACHAWYRLDDEHGLSSPRDHQLLITADFNDYHRLVSMEISEYTVAGPASYIETVDNCVACRAMASMRRERQMEEDADDSINDEAYSDWPYRNDDHDH
ncbi:hypothetical protein CCUS01_09281 [Colletotrichum cuscutae]|uniref:Uncharacterized protein n=1 Tax=Colletotrichum cuscutae TaxID=1209917 RepID=A0AAI9UL71_9PEZI|nr:hypothetical protein CCUS01_09281 [Colletotrichum cuscutae]